MPKRLRYQVAVSLDGFIADPNGGYDWIVDDAAIDFGALFKEFDTAVMGRKTYDLARTQGGMVRCPARCRRVIANPSSVHRARRPRGQ
jgi:dihydrofolate reductase